MHRTSFKAIAVAALAIGALAPATASAVSTAHLDPLATQAAGCQAKGLWGIPAPSATGALVTGAQFYEVTAIIGTSETTPCGPQPVATAGGPTSNSALIQWNAVPGAVAYKIYRAAAPTGPYQALIFAAGPPLVEALPPTAVCPPGGTGTGSRCFFQDNGGPSDPSALAPAAAAATTQAASHPDVKITERIDYGGVNPNSSPVDPSSDDPVSDNPADATPPALKTNVFHFPAGLLANPRATRDSTGAVVTCKLSGPAPSLLGDLTKHGSTDPDEDTCPASTLVGTVQAISRAQGGTITLTEGDIYNADAAAGEPGRLYIVLRPLCSPGSPVAPGSATCTVVLGSAAVEVQKEFLAADSSFVQRADGSYGIDVTTADISSGTEAPLSPTLDVRVTSNGALAGKLTAQVRQLTQTLFGSAGQGTAAAADDVAFMTLPTSCDSRNMTVDDGTWADLTPFSATTALVPTNCAAVPFAPKVTGTVDAVTGTKPKAHPQLDITIAQPSGQISTKSASVTLPAQLGTDITALSRACNETAVGGAANCPASSRVGSALATTPLVAGPLTGPVYLVAQSGALPKLVVLLSGGLSLRLEGTLGVTPTGDVINTFAGLPDVPLSSFTLRVNGGTNGLVANVTDLCGGLGGLKASFTGQDGRTLAANGGLALAGTACGARPRLNTKLSRVGSGRPLLSLKLRQLIANPASRIKAVTLTLPKGLSIRSRHGLKLTTTSKVSSKTYSAKGRRLKVATLPGGSAAALKMSFAKGSLSSSSSLRNKGARQKLTFKFAVTIATGRTYTFTVSVHPKS